MVVDLDGWDGFDLVVDATLHPDDVWTVVAGWLGLPFVPPLPADALRPGGPGWGLLRFLLRR